MVAADNDERMMHCQNMLERGMMLGMDPADLWFDPLFLVVKGMQEKQMEVLEAIKMFSDMGLNSTGGLSNNSNGMPKHIRPIMDSALVAMAMMNGLTSAIVNPNDLRLMETIKSCDVFKTTHCMQTPIWKSDCRRPYRFFAARGWGLWLRPLVILSIYDDARKVVAICSR